MSEHKAEIERLKEVIRNYKEVLCETTQRKDDAIKLNDKLVDEYEIKIKQAKIDVLNELKKYLHTEDFDTPDERWKPESEFCAIIDELIKEIRAQ